MGLFYYPSQTNFVLVDLNMPGNQAFEPLLQQGIIVRSGEALGFPTFIRITVGTAEQNQKIIEAISTCARKIMTQIAIIGIGLIGGSIALSLKKQYGDRSGSQDLMEMIPKSN